MRKRLLRLVARLLLLASVPTVLAAQTTVPVNIPAQTVTLPAITLPATTLQIAAQSINVVVPTSAPPTAICTAGGASRIVPTTAYIANDTVSKSDTAFANTIPLAAGLFTTPGQIVHIVDAFDWSTGLTTIQQLQFQLDGNALGSQAGVYLATPTTAPYEWQADVWITVVAVGTAGEIEVHTSYLQQTQATVINQVSGAVSTFPSTVTYALDTTKAHTLGFATGTYSFSGGSVQQRQPIGIFYP